MDPSKIASQVANNQDKIANLSNNVANNTNGLNVNTPSTPNVGMANKTNPLNITNSNSNQTNKENQEANKGDAQENGASNSRQAEQGEKKESETKPEAGKQVNENGEVEDSSTKKTLKAVGRGAAAYFTGGQSIGKDQAIANMRPVDKTIGVVADTLDKDPAVKAVTKELDEAGLADGVNDVLDTAGSIKNGDIQGAVESGKKALKDTEKAKKYVSKKIILAISAFVVPFLFIAVIVVSIFGPVLGGFIDETNGEPTGAAYDAAEELVDDDTQEEASNIIGEIGGYENLSESRQNIINAAASAVAANIPYSYGSHPYGAGIRGIPEDGLDCAGFVQWALWTGLGGNPGYLTTAAISSKIGTDFIEISESELQPGDIGLKRLGGSQGDDYNHTGIYAGNGQWFHAAGGRTKKVVRSNYSGYTIFLRYKGVS